MAQWRNYNVDYIGDQTLYDNQFIPTKTLDERSDADYSKNMYEFRRYYENVKKTEDITNLQINNDYGADDLMNTNRIDFKVDNDQSTLHGKQETENLDDARYQKQRRTMVNIDSRDRDKTIYGKPNHYIIELNHTFFNVKRITLRSSEFPNSEQLIRDTPASRANNKLYWKNEGDNTVYVASITPGNYKPSSLQSEMQAAMNKVRKINGDFHEFLVSIDTVTDIVSFTSLSTRQVSNPFAITSGSEVVTVTLANHGFSVGNLINISGSVAFGGINIALINTDQIITSVIDVNTFTFELPNGSPSGETIAATGGSSIRIGKGTKFSLLFSFSNTMANILGFELIDTPLSSTATNTVISSTKNVSTAIRINSIFTAITLTTAHELTSGDRIFLIGISGTIADEAINDPGGHLITTLTATDITATGANPIFTFKIPVAITSLQGSGGVMNQRTLNKPVKLAGENYILMTSPILQSYVNTGTVQDIFAKILFSAPPGTILFNTFIGNPKTFETTPLQFLDKIEFFFKTQDNNLFEFNDEDHSFSLEITEYVDVTKGSNFSSRRGIIDET